MNCSLRKLDLSNNYISEKGCREIATAIQFNDTLTSLSLDGNAIGPKGCKHISIALRHTHTLKMLSLENNELTDAALTNLSEGLMKNKSISVLKLSKNMFTKTGIHHLMRSLSKIRVLDLSNNELGSEGCKTLSMNLPFAKNLVTLLLRSNRLGDKGCKYLGEALGGLCSRDMALQCIDISDNGFGRQGVDDLAVVLEESSSVTSIDFSFNEIGADGGEALIQMCSNPAITKLLIEGCCIPDLVQIRVKELTTKNNAIANGRPPIPDNISDDDDILTRTNTCRGISRSVSMSRSGSTAMRKGMRGSGGSRKSNCPPSRHTTLLDAEQRADSIKKRPKFGDPEAEITATCIDEHLITKNIISVQQNEKQTRQIILCGQKIGSSESSLKLAYDLSQSLTYNTTVLKLDLMCNDLGYIGAKRLSRALAPNDTVTELSLAGVLTFFFFFFFFFLKTKFLLYLCGKYHQKTNRK